MKKQIQNQLNINIVTYALQFILKDYFDFKKHKLYTYDIFLFNTVPKFYLLIECKEQATDGYIGIFEYWDDDKGNFKFIPLKGYNGGKLINSWRIIIEEDKYTIIPDSGYNENV